MYIRIDYSDGITEYYSSYEEAEKDILHHKLTNIYVIEIKDIYSAEKYFCSWLFYLKYLGRKPNAY